MARGLLGLKSLKASLTPVGPPSARECGGYLVLSEPQVQFGPHVHGEQVQFGLSHPTDWVVSLLLMHVMLRRNFGASQLRGAHPDHGRMSPLNHGRDAVPRAPGVSH